MDKGRDRGKVKRERKMKKCPHCDNGFVLDLEWDGYRSETICPVCLGTGKIEEKDKKNSLDK